MIVAIKRTGRTITVEVAAEDQFGDEKIVGVGEASCSSQDHFVEKIGQRIALGRAIQDLGKKMESRWDARVVTKEELAERKRLQEERRRVEPDPEPVLESVETARV